MAWGLGRKSFQPLFALGPRSGVHLRARACLCSGSLVTNSSFLRCAARLARVGLFLRFPKYRQEKHRCNARGYLQRVRLHIASNSLRARHGAVLCNPRTPGASVQMQTKTNKQCEHMKRVIRPFQGVAEYFVIRGEIEADIPDACQCMPQAQRLMQEFRKHRIRHAVLDVLHPPGKALSTPGREPRQVTPCFGMISPPI